MLNLLLGKPGSMRAQAPSGKDGGWWPTMRVRTRSNVVVDEDIALTYAAVWCATRVLTEGCMSVPMVMYRRTPDGHRECPEDWRYHLVRTAPNPSMGSAAFWEGRTMHQINNGNGFAEIEFDGDRPVNLWPIHASRVRPVWPWDNKPGFDYIVRNNDGSSVALRASEVLHIPGACSEDGVWAKGVITQARESVGMGIATESHGSAYFAGGAQPRAVISGAGLKDKEQRAQFRREWKEIHGSPDSGEIAIMPTDAKYTAITLSNEDSQFLETRKYNVVDIARWYRVPPHKLMDLDRATFSNIEHQSIEVVYDAILPWLLRRSEQLALKLLTPAERLEYFFGFDLTTLLRGDFKTRMEGYQTALMNGIMTLNDVMRAEGWNTIGPEGDRRFMPVNLTTIDRLIAGNPAAGDPGDDVVGQKPPPA
jgi:HK97 family phage portal protein